MALYLHNPASEAHLQDLRERLVSELVPTPYDRSNVRKEPDRIEMLVNVVRAMDKGLVSTKEALETFTRHGFPGFSKWLVDMLDEGVYLDSRFDKGRVSEARILRKPFISAEKTPHPQRRQEGQVSTLVADVG